MADALDGRRPDPILDPSHITHVQVDYLIVDWIHETRETFIFGGGLGVLGVFLGVRLVVVLLALTPSLLVRLARTEQGIVVVHSTTRALLGFQAGLDYLLRDPLGRFLVVLEDLGELLLVLLIVGLGVFLPVLSSTAAVARLIVFGRVLIFGLIAVVVPALTVAAVVAVVLPAALVP